jgi:hypothetical protein
MSSNDAEIAPDVSLAEHQAPPAVAILNARLLPPNLLSHDRNRATMNDKPADNGGTWVKPLYLIISFLLALVVLSYYAVFRYFLSGSAHGSDEHPGNSSIDDRYANPEFYRKLRRGVALKKS